MNVNRPQSRGFAVPELRHRQSEERSGRPFYLNLLPDIVRNHFVAMAGEFAGTFLFLFFAFSGTQVANSQVPVLTKISQGPDPAKLLYISISFGFSLAVNAWVFFRISGGLFNPAVTFGMCLVGALPLARGALIVGAQMLGAITAAAVVSILFPGPLNVQTSLGGGTSVAQGLFIEMFLTTELVFTIFMLAAEKHKATYIAPVGIGLSLFIAELTGVYFTGGAVNPARAFGPCVVLHSFDHYHWIYWVGPMLGTIIASGFYKFIKVLEYETANPGQDMDKADHLNRLERNIDSTGTSVSPEYDSGEDEQRQGSIGRYMSAGSGREGTNDPRRGFGWSVARQSRESAARGPKRSSTMPC